MHRIDTTTAATALPTPAAAGTPGFFRPGNPTTGELATQLSADWCNALQEEIITVLAAAGITPNKTSTDQLLAAIRALIAASGQLLQTSGKSGTYTAVPGDYGKIITFIGDGTLVLPTAPSLGAGWWCWVWLYGGVVTVLPSGGNLIDGAGALTLYLGEKVKLVCDGGTYWIVLSSTAGAVPSCTLAFGFYVASPPGWVLINDGSIGAPGSGATMRAANDCYTVFANIWGRCSNTWAPLQDSAGTPVARGASAAADFSAGRRLVLPKMLGRALAAAGSGAGLTPRVPGQFLGEETHTLTTAEMPIDGITPHAGSGGLIEGYGTGAPSADNYDRVPGGHGDHNNIQPSFWADCIIKL